MSSIDIHEQYLTPILRYAFFDQHGKLYERFWPPCFCLGFASRCFADMDKLDGTKSCNLFLSVHETSSEQQYCRTCGLTWFDASFLTLVHLFIAFLDISLVSFHMMYLNFFPSRLKIIFNFLLLNLTHAKMQQSNECHLLCWVLYFCLLVLQHEQIVMF